MAWKVPAQGKVPSTSRTRPAKRAARRVISAAARRVKVSSDAPGIHAAPNEPCHPMRQGLGLARTCARDHQQRPVTVLDRSGLGRVERVVMRADLHLANTMQMFS
jgi:hypothetical protein